MNASEMYERVEMMIDHQIEKRMNRRTEIGGINNMIKETIKRISDEKDKNFYMHFPIEKLTACLEVVDVALHTIGDVIEYLEQYLTRKHPYVHGWETALTIDAICNDFGIDVCAEGFYQIQENIEKSSDAFPLGSCGGYQVSSQEFGEDLSYEEYYDRLSSKCKRNNRTEKEKIKEVVEEMKALKKDLWKTRESVLDYIIHKGCWSDWVDVTAEVSTRTGTYWEVITLTRTGRSFKRPSTNERMEDVLSSDCCQSLISIDRRKISVSRKMKEVCCLSYIDLETVIKAMAVIKEVIGVMEKDPISEEEWVQECRKNRVLQQYISSIRHDRGVYK